MLNIVALVGRMVADPELRQIPQGTSVTSFRIAVDRNFARAGEQRQADFIDVIAWRQAAEFVCKYFQKGSWIAVDGSLQTRMYQDKQGNNRKAVEVIANNVSFCGSKSGGVEQANTYTPPADNRTAEHTSAVPEYSAGNNDDFAIVDEGEDLPF